MKVTGFFIDDCSIQHIIRATDSDLEVIVHLLTPTTVISPEYDDFVLFASGDGAPLAFVASGLQTSINEFIPALLWYLKYLNKPDMLISKDDPREWYF